MPLLPILPCGATLCYPTIRAMTTRSKSRDIHDLARKTPRRSRLPGELPYPVEYTKDQQAMSVTDLQMPTRMS